LLTLSAAGKGNMLYALVRDHKIAVTVTPLPFIPHGIIKKLNLFQS
jgi:hypothetical protein